MKPFNDPSVLQHFASWANTAPIHRVLVKQLNPSVDQCVLSCVTFINTEKAEKDFQATLLDLDFSVHQSVEFNAVVVDLDNPVIHFHFHLVPSEGMVIVQHVHLELEWRRRKMASNMLEMLEAVVANHGYHTVAIDAITTHEMSLFASHHGFAGSVRRATKQIRPSPTKSFSIAVS